MHHFCSNFAVNKVFDWEQASWTKSGTPSRWPSIARLRVHPDDDDEVEVIVSVQIFASVYYASIVT